MFETSLATSRKTALRRGNWRLLPLAVFAHMAVLAGVVLAQVWGVERIAPPPDKDIFWVGLQPPLPPPPGPPRSPVSRPPAAPPNAPAPQPPPTEAQPHQPTEIDDPPPPTRSPDANVPPGLSQLDTLSGPGGPGDGPGVPGGLGDTSDTILQITSDITPPELVKRVAPVYTEAARITHTEGAVLLEAVIDTQGNVGQVKVLRSLAMGLDGKAVEAVRQWKYRPARRHGQPVSVYLYVTVEYRLR